MLEWLRDHHVFYWVPILSVVTLALSVALLPFFVARLPVDHFTHRKRHPVPYRHPVLVLVLRVLRNAIGFLLAAAGIAMLVLPGPGVPVLLVGLALAEFPGKFRLERWLVRRPAVLRSLNWLRARRGAPPLRAPAGPAAEGLR